MDDKKFMLGLGAVLVIVLLVAVATSSNTQTEKVEESNGLPQVQEKVSDDNPSSGKINVNLETVNKDVVNQSGTATLEEKNDKVEVVLSLTTESLTGPQSAHIHSGECPGVGAVVFPLTNVVNGMSTTLLDTTLTELRAQLPLAINVHKSTDEVKVYTACGSLK